MAPSAKSLAMPPAPAHSPRQLRVFRQEDAAAPWRQRCSPAAIPVASAGCNSNQCGRRRGDAEVEKALKKRNPAKAGNKFVHFGGILQTAGDRGGSGSRLASPCLLDAPWTLQVQRRDINSNLPDRTANVTDCPSTNARCDSSTAHLHTIGWCRLHCREIGCGS